LRRPGGTERVFKQAIASIVAVCVVALVTGRGQERQSLAAPMHPQQPVAPARPPAGSPGTRDGESETTALRADALEQLKGMGAPATPVVAAPGGNAAAAPVAGAASGSTPPVPEGAPPVTSPSSISIDHGAQKSLYKLYQERVHWLDEYDKLTLAQNRAASPESSPENQAAQAKAELKNLNEMLAQAANAPETLLPPSFLKTSGKSPRAFVPEMKDAIDATTNEMGEWKGKLEALKSGTVDRESKQKARTAERDKVFQRVTTLKAKSVEKESAVTDAQSHEHGRLARERLINYQWEVRVESLRLQVVEDQIALEVKLADARELETQVCQAHLRLTQRMLEQMRARYREASEKEERALNRAEADEKSKAQSSRDPLERFRARRMAELLALEALALKSEQALATNPSPSFEEQRTLADRADKDFARIKELLDDGRVSRLDAIRLNNDFRRIGPERERLLRNEMAVVEAQLQFFEDALTNVEIELLQNSLHDRFEQDLLRERVSPERWADGEKLLNELEHRHREILERRRVALERLTERASHTLQQVVRRLGILDQEYGFIRTVIFWVRDQEPIALGTMWIGAREFSSVIRALLQLAQESMKPNLWCRPSAEFMATSFAALVLPVLLLRLRRALASLIQPDLSESHS
jgi:potassium efflux system protein